MSVLAWPSQGQALPSTSAGDMVIPKQTRIATQPRQMHELAARSGGTRLSRLLQQLGGEAVTGGNEVVRPGHLEPCLALQRNRCSCCCCELCQGSRKLWACMEEESSSCM